MLPTWILLITMFTALVIVVAAARKKPAKTTAGTKDYGTKPSTATGNMTKSHEAPSTWKNHPEVLSQSSKQFTKEVAKESLGPDERHLSAPEAIASKVETVCEKETLTATKDGGWVINPGSPFRLTLYGIDQPMAVQVKHLLDESGTEKHTAEKVHSLFSLILRYNLRCKEIDAYIAEFRPVYLKTLADLQRTSAEWATATEKDRKDLLLSFREQALTSLDIRPRGNLVTLFEDTPSDMKIDDALLDRFGYEALELYMRFAEPQGKLHVLSQKHSDRVGFEKLVGLGLAVRGADIPLPALVDTLKLKDLKAIVADLEPPALTRKAQAVAYLLSLPDATERVGKIVACSDLFQLRPFPEEFAQVDLQQVASAWRYTREMASLIAETYARGYDAVEQKQLHKELDTKVTGWTIIVDEQACSYCKRAAERAHSPGQTPRVPLHIGCHCHIAPQYVPLSNPTYTAAEATV
jgi:hypothetical protein